MKKLLFAPMATLSHEAMRLTIERCSARACDEYYTEMIQATSFLAGGKFEPYYVRSAPDITRIVWQLTCGKTEPMAEAARVVAANGGIGVDINMGCSAPDIAKQGAGISWMTKPVTETAAMVRAVRAALDSHQRLSVKLRLGGEDFTIQGLCDFATMLINEGVTQLVIHPRTGKEKFRRTPHWQYAEQLAQFVHATYGDTVCVCGNGNITDTASLDSVMTQAPSLDGYMIGRAAVQKPWIFATLRRLFEAQAAGVASQQAAQQNDTLRQSVPFAKKDAPDVPAPHSESAPLSNKGAPQATEVAPQQNGAPDANNSAPQATEVAPQQNGAPDANTSAPPECARYDLQQIALDFLHDLRQSQPNEFWLTRAQRFFAYYSANFGFAHYLATQTSNAQSIDGVEEAFLAYLDKMPEERFIQICTE